MILKWAKIVPGAFRQDNAYFDSTTLRKIPLSSREFFEKLISGDESISLTSLRSIEE